METKVENVSLDRNENEMSYQFIFKIILIGDANCGKTSIIHRYVTKCFNDKYICTIGVDFFMKSIKIQDQTVKLQLWDTAGMEKYKQITTSYYRGAQAAVICFDLTCRNSFNSVSKWIDEFSKFYNPIFQKNIFIVGNKSDLENREVSQEEIDNLIKTNNYTYFQTSAKSGDNIENLFMELANTLFISYKNNATSQISNAVRIRRTTINSSDKVQDIMTNESKKNKKCC